jgi:cell division protein FtsW (lipid II flippase)
MPSKQFLQQVTSYIRSKEARRQVEEELQHHITQSKQAWMNKGYSAKEAEKKAIAEMGSATQLGKSMDKIHKPKWDFWLIGAVVLLMIASFIPILTMDFGRDMTSYYVVRKSLHIALAAVSIAAIMFFDYRLLQRFSLYIYGIALLLLVILLYMPNVVLQGEAMVQLGPLRLHAWMVLPLLLIAVAGFFSERKWKGWQLTSLSILPIFFFMQLPNLPVTLLYIAVIAVLFSFSYFNRKVKLYVFSVVGGIGIGLLALFVYYYHNILKSYQTERIAAFLNPEQYADYMIHQLRQALAEAGLFGAKETIYIPGGHTDFALVQLIQSYGFVAGISVMLVILAVALRILWMNRTMPQSFGKLLVVAAVTLYSVQSIYSIFMVFGLLPLASIPLPFISYGMTPLLLNAILIGLVLSVYRRKSIMSTKLVTD